MSVERQVVFFDKDWRAIYRCALADISCDDDGNFVITDLTAPESLGWQGLAEYWQDFIE